jgi:geranylgeranyl reductase family protein
MRSYDVAVVGGGPSGAWAAYNLAARGASVAIIDGSHPREKPCGGGITGRALDVVRGAFASADVPSIAVRSARFTDAATSESASVALEPTPGDPEPLVVASRAAFDAQLFLIACGAGAHPVAARLTGITPDAAGFDITTTAGPLRARFVVGADGANSGVRRQLACRFRRDQLSVATGYFAHGVSSSEIVIEFVDDPPGYIWSFPRPDHLAVGICAQADAGVTPQRLRAKVASWMDRMRLASGARLEAYSWPIPSLGARDLETSVAAGRGWCVIGDAAGLVDPITREGIYFALASAQWAADAISAGEADCLQTYAARVREEIVPELASAARLKQRFFTPRFTRLMMRALRESESIRAVMADLVAGRQSYRTLRWRLVRTMEVGLAWRLLVSGRSSRRAPARAHSEI